MECRCQYAASSQESPQHGGKMAKITRFFRRGQKPDQQTENLKRKDLYELLGQDDWDAILSCDVEGEDILTACECAVKKDDIAGATKLLFVMSSFTRFSYSKSPALNRAWQYVFTEVITSEADVTSAMEMLARAEKDERFEEEKTLLNNLMESLLTLQAPLPQTSPVQRVLQWCQKEGHYSFAFDVALSSGNMEEAHSILTAMYDKSKEHVLMLQDIASQSQHVIHAVSFVEVCFQKGRIDFAFSLATKLKLWSVIEENIEDPTLSTALLRSALTECVLGEKWDIAQKILGHLSLQDVGEELFAIPKAYDVSTVIDLMAECDFLPVAIQMACSFGMPHKAAQIIRDKAFMIDPALSVSTAKACFDSQCNPEEFLVKDWDRNLLQHVLEAPRRKPFSQNQWRCVLNFLDSALPKEAVCELFKRAVEEDVECLDQFIGRGVEDELMEILLTQDPEKVLSDNHLNCVVKLFYKEAGVDLTDTKNVSSVQTPNKGMVSVEETKSSMFSGSDTGQSIPEKSFSQEEPPHNPKEKKSVFPCDVDWTTFVPRCADVPVSPWWYVLRAAQAARNSQHIRHLAVRAAQEGQWNCLICLAMHGLHQHPLDLLLSLLHDYPERLVLSYLQQKEQWEVQKDLHCCQEGWKKFFHDIDILNLHSRGLLEERHRMIFLGRALATDNWVALMKFSSLDLPLPARRAVFKKAMDGQNWLLAREMFDQLPDKADPYIFQTALKELNETSEHLYTWMLETGLSNAYLAPEMFTRLLKDLEEKEATRKAEHQPEPKTPFWKRFRPKPKYNPPIGFQRPNPAVTAGNKDCVTSALGKVVRKAATEGDWKLVMKVYEGGMGEEVKMAVVEEALGQGCWSVLGALSRRDVEADLWSSQWADKILQEAVNNGAWPCVEAVAERGGCRGEDAAWLMPVALDSGRWSLVLRLLEHGLLSPQLREMALWTALDKNEWTFVMASTLHLAKTCPEDFHPRLKQAVLKSMAQMITTLQPSSSPGATTFGLHLFSRVKATEEGQGRGQGQSVLDGCGSQGGEECVPGKGEEETEVDWATEDGSTLLQTAAGLGLWKACQVLLHCGVNPHPSPTPSHPNDVILLALRHNQPDVIRTLLDYDVTPGVADRALGELLLTPTLELDADIHLLRKLLEKRKPASASAVEERPAPDDVTQPADVISVDTCDVTTLADQVGKVLEKAGASRFQPHVSRAVETGHIALPAFLAPVSRVLKETSLLEVKRTVPRELGLSEDRSHDAFSCQLGPRVMLRVGKEPRDSPIVRLLSPLVSDAASPANT